MAAQPLPRVFSLLGMEKDPAVDDALREALPSLRAEVRDAALKMICDRGSSTTLAKLLVRSSSLEPDLRQAIYDRIDLFHPGLREALNSRALEDRAAAIGVIVAANDYKSAHWLAESLRVSCSRTRELAGGAIRKLTERHVVSRLHGVAPEHARDFHLCAQRLGDMHKGLIEHWESHTRLDVLICGLWMMEHVESALSAKLAQPQNRIRPALLKILSGPSDPRLARFTLWSLSQADLKAAAAQLITQAADPGFMEAIMEECWLLADPELARAFHGVHDVSQWKNWITNQQLDAKKATPVIRMIACAGGPRDRILNQLLSIAQQSAQPVRRAVLWQLVQDDSPGATQKLAEIGARTDDELAPIAAREARRRQRRDCPVAGPARGSDSSRAWKAALDKFIEEEGQLSPQERIALASQLRSFADLQRCMEQRLGCSFGTDKARTIRAVEALGLSSALRTRLYQCAHDTDSTVRAAALWSLREDASPTAARILNDALHDPDPRVQAQAIECMEKLGLEKKGAAVAPKLESRNNRVRANAIKALWTVELQKASRELERMLQDESPDHRLSALWVVERVKLSSVLSRLGAMAHSDPNRQVQVRARRLLRRLRGIEEAATVQ